MMTRDEHLAAGEEILSKASNLLSVAGQELRGYYLLRLAEAHAAFAALLPPVTTRVPWPMRAGNCPVEVCDDQRIHPSHLWGRNNDWDKEDHPLYCPGRVAT